MTSMERVLTTLRHQEPDRVPVFLLLTMHGARELGISIREYFSRPDYVAEGQMRMLRKFGHDCIYTFFYAAVETEAWGGDVVYIDEGPPNAGAPLVSDVSDLVKLTPPVVKSAACLQKVLEATRALKAGVGDSVPIIGVVMSPISLPVMQLGFERYLEVIYEMPDLFAALMRMNEAFCVEWANAQLEAGATAICYFDPVSSPTIIPADLYQKTGFAVACRTLARIKGPTATHMASGRCLPVVEALVQTGTAVIGTSALENLSDVKRAFGGRLTILGNLNGLEMVDWSVDEARKKVGEAIEAAAPGGGFILSDNHGEVPFQVKDETLFAIVEAAKVAGRYPILGGKNHG